MPLPVVSPDPVFADSVSSLMIAADVVQSSLRNLSLRQWFLGRVATLPDIPDWSGDPSDIEGMADAFNRDQLGADYAEALATAETLGQTTACKIQSDYLATMERAARLRHASPVRVRALAASRRLGHASPSGVIGRVETMVSEAIEAGNAT